MHERPGQPRLSLRPPVLFGVITMIGFLISFGAWAVSAPLDSAVVAEGKVVVSGQRKTVTHPTGGIVEEILVAEGDRVRKGDTVLRLIPTLTQAEYDRLKLRHRAAVARTQRYRAAYNDAERINFSMWLQREAKTDPQLKRIFDAQRAVFTARTQEFHDQSEKQKQRIRRFKREIEGLNGENIALKRQINLVDEELEGLGKLFDKGLLEKPRYLKIQRRRAELEQALRKNETQAASAASAIEETRHDIEELASQFAREAADGLRESLEESYELAEQLQQAKFNLDQTEIKAPADGIVVNRRIHTPGSSISAGQRLVDVVPANRPLVAEVRINPNDVDMVQPGMTARVRLKAVSSRWAQPLSGKLTTVSADILTDEKSGQTYFRGRIVFDASGVPKVHGVDLRPGMKVEAIVLGEKRSLVDYLFTPITRTMDRALRES